MCGFTSLMCFVIAYTLCIHSHIPTVHILCTNTMYNILPVARVSVAAQSAIMDRVLQKSLVYNTVRCAMSSPREWSNGREAKKSKIYDVHRLLFLARLS